MADSAAALQLLDISLELEPDCTLKEVQDPLGHGVKLVWLKPTREVALIFVVHFLETQRESHEIDSDTGFTQIKELFTIFNKIVRHCQSVQGLETLSQSHVMDKLKLSVLFLLLTFLRSICRLKEWQSIFIRRVWSIIRLLFSLR